MVDKRMSMLYTLAAGFAVDSAGTWVWKRLTGKGGEPKKPGQPIVFIAVSGICTSAH
jgi:hypothetical protein